MSLLGYILEKKGWKKCLEKVPFMNTADNYLATPIRII